jgi:arabinogalactan endo-1,4-beta-galactosidase
MPAASALASDGQVSVVGIVAGTSRQVTANLTVTSVLNYAQNPGLESGLLAPWTVAGNTTAINASNEPNNPHSGTWALHYWLDKPFAGTVSQTVTGLDSGTYSLSAWFQGVGDEKALQLFVTCGGTTLTKDVVNSGWQKWTQPTIDKIVVADGTCSIGVKVEAGAGIWGFVDDFELVKSN